MKKQISELKTSTPGRICLFGEHQDYLNLPIIASAINLRISVKGHKRNDSKVIIHLHDIGSEESFSIAEPIVYEKQRDYLKSCVNVLKRHGLTFSKGIDCVVHGEIPINAGTSSSSALVVTWINFLARMSDQSRELSPEDIAQYSYEAEVLEFSEPGGMMDQYTTSVGGTIFLDSYPEIKVEKLRPRLGTLVLGNSNEPKDTVSILARVKNQMQRVVKDLQKSYPEFSLRTITQSQIDDYTRSLSGDQVELLRGTVNNRDITRLALSALSDGADDGLIGRLLNDHQEVLRDVLKISTPKIDRMIQASLDAGALGGKINGSGGGGCMFAYAPNQAEKVKKAIEKEGGQAYIVSIDEGTREDFSEED